MAYDEELAFRLRAALETVDGITSKRMFGGMAFLLGGNMLVAASSKGNLMVRVDPAERAEALTRPHVSTMIMGGREAGGWIRVDEPGYDTDEALQRWIDLAHGYVATLPAK
jgi:TfoX/Sxy family transcriptional regulator of competence genes